MLNLTAFADGKKSENKYNQKNNKLIWEKVNTQSKDHKSKIEWKKYKHQSDDESYQIELINPKNYNDQNNLLLNEKGINNSVNSFNRSIVINDKDVGPDITFLIPLGFKSSEEMNLDFSIRGWNRRPKDSDLFAWNNGDAVAQVFLNILKNEKSSVGLNLGIRSLYSGSQFSGGSTDFGEGLSMGFRIDRALSDSSGLALGAEQLIHFDDRTDTGRDIYITYSKAFWNKKDKNIFPFTVLTGGIGTGYLALWKDTKFACSDLIGGAAVDVGKYHPLCWGPFGAISFVFSNKFASFIEYNNYSFMIGSSIAPTNKIRLTFGLTLAESFDDYKVKNFDELRWFSRISLGF
ncbi:hypothetical protein OA518_01415 [Prochlorococcus sp. AH-716-F10]|nr:hypothetical protein [Prochlorococcus sp. AH-716-F10]